MIEIGNDSLLIGSVLAIVCAAEVVGVFIFLPYPKYYLGASLFVATLMVSCFLLSRIYFSGDTLGISFLFVYFYFFGTVAIANGCALVGEILRRSLASYQQFVIYILTFLIVEVLLCTFTEAVRNLQGIIFSSVCIVIIYLGSLGITQFAQLSSKRARINGRQ